MDIHDFLLRCFQRKLYLPPRRLRKRVGEHKLSRFESTGQEYVDHLKKFCQLIPKMKALDIGCGCGRISIPLTNFINEKGRYFGVDVDQEMIGWCQDNISKKYSNFQFIHADVKNDMYNPKGKFLVKTYAFPFKDKSFDLVIIVSVLTHMLAEDVKDLLKETSRLLRTKGKALIALCLLNEVQQKLAKVRLNKFNFQHDRGGYKVIDKDKPENVVAYKEPYLLNLIAECGLKVVEPIHYGRWSGRKDGLSFLDIVVLKRRQ